MNKGAELYTLIKCQTKEGTEKLRDIHCQINDVLYYWAYRYITPDDANDLLNTLKQYGIELNGLEVPEKALPKKQEILKKLREICQVLIQYKQVPITKNDYQAVTGTCRYQVSQYIKAKQNNNLTDEAILQLMQENKRIRTNMLEPYSKIQHLEPYKAFDGMNAELMDILAKRYI